MRKVSLMVLALVFGLLLSGQAGSQEKDKKDKDVKGKNHTVEMQDNKFVPDKLTVAVGDTITWVNKGKNDHTATADKKEDPNFFDTKVVAPDKSSAPVTFKKAGDVPYHCEKHPAMMKGTITVK